MAYSFNQRVPEFFKVYLPEDSFESLLIPDSFVSFCNRLMPKNAVLSNHMGSFWHVMVDCIDGRVFFLNGWKQFVLDNSIQSGDLVIFRYNGQCGFSVKVFGQDACEKIENKANGTSYMNKVKLEDNEEEKQKEEETKENKNEDDEEEKQKEEETKENDNEDKDCDDNDDSDYEDYIGEQEEDSTKEEVSIENSRAGKQPSVGNIGGSKKRDDVKVEGGSKRIDVIIIEAEVEELTTRKSIARKQSVGNNGGPKKMAAVKVEAGSKRTNPVNIEEEEESTTRKNRARKQSCGNNGVSEKMPVHMSRRGYKRTNDVPLEVLDLPKLIQPQNPFFIAKLKTRTERNLLFVPVKVLKRYQLKFPNLIFFRNKHGMQWPAKVYNWKDGRILICGWNDFCRANNVSLDDCCICEFPQGNNQEVNFIDVHIVCNTGEGAGRKQRSLNKNG